MNNKHTPEPWGELKHVQEAGMGDCFVVRDEKKECIFIAEKANARRIVACVNACAGMTTEGLETFNVNKEMRELAEERAEFQGQRDELLAALKEVLISWGNYNHEHQENTKCRARALIKKYDHA